MYYIMLYHSIQYMMYCYTIDLHNAVSIMHCFIDNAIDIGWLTEIGGIPYAKAHSDLVK